MTPASPKPLRHEATESEDPELRLAGELLEAAHQETPWPLDAQARLFHRIRTSEQSRQGRRRVARRVSWAAAVLASGMLVWSAQFWRPVLEGFARGLVAPTETDPLATLHVQASEGARYRILAGDRSPQRRIALDQGELSSGDVHRSSQGSVSSPGSQSSQSPIRVETRWLSMTATTLGARWRVVASAAQVEVVVQSGRVLVESVNGQAIVLLSGESVSAPSLAFDRKPRKEPGGYPFPTGVSGGSPACHNAPGPAEQLKCYETLAAGQDLAAQNALFAWGWLENQIGTAESKSSALARFREYQKRFPKGAFAPEASEAVIGLLMTMGKDEAALAEAEQYRERFPLDPRRFEIELLHGHLLRRRGQYGQAGRVYQAVLAEAMPVVLQSEALYFMGVSRWADGSEREAKSHFEAYLSTYPTGAYASPIRRLLSQE